MQDFGSVKGKVVIVTGAASGIGEAIAKVYADHGMKVVCADYDITNGTKVAEQIGEEAIFQETDCSNAKCMKAVVDIAVSHYNRLDGIVNCAGIGMGGSPLHEYSDADAERIIDLNLKGIFSGMKYAAEAIFKSQDANGFMINIASVAGLVAQRGQALYSATKHGVVGMTKSAALDYAPYNVTVNAICPGYTETAIFRGIPDQAKQIFIKGCPAARMGTPEECAYLALFLASDMARYITGAAIPVDGALSAGIQNVSTWKHPEILEA